MSTEIASFTPVNTYELVGGDALPSYCSMKTDTVEEKQAFFNAISDPDVKLADCINTVINVKDIYCETVTLTDEKTGEQSIAPRIVLVDTEGKSYQAVSTGIFNSLRRLMQVFGNPTWENGLPVKVVQKNIGTNRLYTLVCAK